MVLYLASPLRMAMGEGGDASEFDASRAELFEALGHPVRLRILHSLQDGPLGFADLKRKVGIESGGHLQFHLGKLDGLIRSGEDGNYSLTDDGKEALRIVGTEGGRASDKVEGRDRIMGVPFHRILTVGLLAALILIGSIAVYQQLEILGLGTSVANLQQQNGLGVCGANGQAGNFDFSSESTQVVSSSGLGINLTVSNGSIRCGDTVYANVSLFNTLDSNLTLPVNASSLSSLGDWAYHSANPCGHSALVQMAVFDGYYTESNFSRAGEPLQLGDLSVAISCTTVVGSLSGLVFLPQSGIAYGLNNSPSLNGQLATTSASLRHWGCSPEGGNGGSVCSQETGASGYYSGATSANNGFHLFHFGAYTLAASDVWGDTALVHFVVQ